MIEFIEKTIKSAGEILLQSSRSVIKEKGGGGNVVLRADLDTEHFIIEAIQETFPHHAILSEETHDQIVNPEKKDHLWIVDPLDGTTNAKYHIPFFAISIAYVEEGVVKAGGIFDPNRNEFFSAEKGKGAFCNKKRITISDKNDLQGLIVNVGSPYNEANFNITYPYGRNFHQHSTRIVNFGSAVLECAWVSCGRLGAYLEAGLKPWDIAAANLILSEAGGVMIDPYNLKKSFSIFTQKSILVGNTIVVEELKTVMKLNNNTSTLSI